ncbi:origin recognition complex subunit 2-domain-containing protein [Choanephora cucurbitarum]|nr:origin recognition complex subunit 2-domain-containing protein [Choanephora cucurbitarum]
MRIHRQTDQEIPIHIVSKVDTGSAQSEYKLALEHHTGKKPKRREQTYDFGLTVTKQQQQQHEAGSQPHQTEQDDTGEILSHFKPMDVDQEENNDDVSGRSMFRFQQSIKKNVNTLMNKALEDDGQQKKKGRVKQTKKNQAQIAQVKTNHSKRRRIQKHLDSLRNDSEEEQDTSSSEDEEQQKEKPIYDDNEEEEEESGRGVRSKLQDTFDEVEGHERYFQSQTPSKTSDNTLARLPVLEPQEFHHLLEKTPKKHYEEFMILSEMHKQHFSQWCFELHSGFNLVFYGYGSKRTLLNEFAQEVLTDGPLVVVNGFFPSISIKDILVKITSGGALGAHFKAASTSSILDHVNAICDYFSNPDRDYQSLYLVIHNLDGPNLRNERTQTALSMLAHADNIHLIASVDHINAGLLWDNVKSSRFNWIWHDATTFADYLVETSFENSMMIRQGELGGARGAKYVLDSLTYNARGVFKVLAEYQLEAMDDCKMEGKGNESVGLTYSQYYQKCREGFYVSSDLSFRTELTEFRDHKLIFTKKGSDGTEFFFIPLDKTALINLLEQINH